MFDEFFDFGKECFRRSGLPRVWGKAVNWLTVVFGWVLLWVVYKHPAWTSTQQAKIALLFGFIVPIGAATFAVIGRILLSPFLVYRDAEIEHKREVDKWRQESGSLTSQLESLTNDAKEKRVTARQDSLERACLALKNGDAMLMPFHALYVAEAYKFESNGDLVQLCQDLVTIGNEHPFKGLDQWVLQTEWLDYLKWGHLHPTYNFADGGDYLKAVEDWNERQGRTPPKESLVWRGVMGLALDEAKRDLRRLS